VLGRRGSRASSVEDYDQWHERSPESGVARGPWSRSWPSPSTTACPPGPPEPHDHLPAGVNADLKAPCLIAGMAAGADSIDDHSCGQVQELSWQVARARVFRSPLSSRYG
jgi:hypothetical protein